ncbi:hypothetical protein ZIOFF_027509 [Zingiber officinale]|uniref:Acyl carrier protein n=1 Tax=Zingiber officinale TaxID=94328 RepID=A0A8J5L991_ZINOF|nr:hypothetical protein ZIOFF_027509 [Zingiber officinale]
MKPMLQQAPPPPIAFHDNPAFSFLSPPFRVVSVPLADRWHQSLELRPRSRFVRRGDCCRFPMGSLVSNQFPSQTKERALSQSAQHLASEFLALFVGITYNAQIILHHCNHVFVIPSRHEIVLNTIRFFEQAKPETMEKVCFIVRKQLAIADDTPVTGESIFSQLGADSLDTVEIVMGLEEEFGISVEEESAQSISTVQHAADMIELLLEKKKAA